MSSTTTTSRPSTYHQLGRVAQEQRRWPEAEEFYQKALALKVEFNDRYSQAGTYGQLSLLAEAQERFVEAADLQLKALALSAEFEDQHSLAIALRALARLRKAGGDEGLVDRVADVLGASAEEAAKLLDQATGEEDAEDGGRGNALTKRARASFRCLFIRSANFLKRNCFVIPAKRSASRDRKKKAGVVDNACGVSGMTMA